MTALQNQYWVRKEQERHNRQTESIDIANTVIKGVETTVKSLSTIGSMIGAAIAALGA